MSGSVTFIVRALLAIVLVASVTGTASAQSADPSGRQPSAAEVSIARDQFKVGLEAAKQNKWEDARKAFQHSYDLFPRPLTLLNLAGAQAQTGQLVVAGESYRRFIRESTGTPAAEQKAAAQQTLAQLDARTPRFRVKFDGAAANDRLDLDGQALNNASLGLPVPVDPGDHKLTVVRDGVEIAKTSFHINERESRDIVVVAPPPAVASTPDPAPVATPAPSAAPAPATSDRSLGYLQPVPPAKQPQTESSKGGVLRSPWFWGAAAAVVVGSAIAIGVAASHSSGSTSSEAPYTGNLSPSQIVVR